jgi:hypothetical protein
MFDAPSPQRLSFWSSASPWGISSRAFSECQHPADFRVVTPSGTLGLELPAQVLEPLAAMAAEIARLRSLLEDARFEISRLASSRHAGTVVYPAAPVPIRPTCPLGFR